ncbi:mechanosensitive ion channel family protein [Halobacteriales archaeon Cl-PHB]
MAATATPGDNSTGLPWAADLIPDWLNSQLPEWLLPFLGSIVVFVLAWVAGRLLVKVFGRRVARRLERPSLTRTALRGMRAIVFLLAFFLVLRINGLDLGNIALSVTVFTAVVGVILAPIVGSVISGVFLLADQPYEIGDMIELAQTGQRGFVEDITLRYTKIFTLDNTFLVVPNGTMRERDVYNYSAEDPRTRQSLDILITYESDLGRARDRIETAARRVDQVIEGGPSIRIGAARYPAAPTCLIEEFGDHGVLLTLRYWVKEPYRVKTVRSEVQTNVWNVLAEEDVDFAYPHSHLIFDETSGKFDLSPNGSPGWTASPGRQPSDGGDHMARASGDASPDAASSADEAADSSVPGSRPTDGDESPKRGDE